MTGKPWIGQREENPPILRIDESHFLPEKRVVSMAGFLVSGSRGSKYPRGGDIAVYGCGVLQNMRLFYGSQVTE
jgi:hypothetical protein